MMSVYGHSFLFAFLLPCSQVVESAVRGAGTQFVAGMAPARCSLFPIGSEQLKIVVDPTVDWLFCLSALV